MHELSSKFLDFLRYEKRYSEHTIISYQTDLNQFLDFLKDSFAIDSLSNVEGTDIRSWVMTLMDNGMAEASVNRKISTIKRFFRYLVGEDILTVNPSLKVVAPKIKKRLPLFIPERDLISKLDSSQLENSFNALRNQLIIEMLYATGIRLSELINLSHADLDIYNQQIKVLGKRNKERLIPFAVSFKDLMNSYFEKKKEVGLSLDGYVFVKETGEPMYSKQIYTIVRQFLADVTTLQRKSPHVLRHTFATHMLNNGADLNAIKELLGHSSLASTQVYTHNSIEKLKSTYKQAHPKA